MSNEIGRLAQGNDHGVTSIDTIDSIHKREVPQGRDIMYANFILDYCPLKDENHRVLVVVGGDKLSYFEDAGAPAASILETKISLNSVISDAATRAKFASFDIKYFFLATPMDKTEYMRLMWKHIPDDIKKKYNLYDKKAHDGCVYIKIKRDVRPQAGSHIGI